MTSVRERSRRPCVRLTPGESSLRPNLHREDGDFGTGDRSLTGATTNSVPRRVSGSR
jgi:hypothetical protein